MLCLHSDTKPNFYFLKIIITWLKNVFTFSFKMLIITGSYSPFAQLLVTYILSKKSWYQLSDQRKAAVYIKTRAFSLLQYYLP